VVGELVDAFLLDEEEEAGAAPAEDVERLRVMVARSTTGA
jgi:hypothetical protein